MIMTPDLYCFETFRAFAFFHRSTTLRDAVDVTFKNRLRKKKTSSLNCDKTGRGKVQGEWLREGWKALSLPNQ